MAKRAYIRHDLISLRSETYARKCRGRSLVDRRSAAGINATNVQQELIRDQGGAANMSTARLVLVEIIARDVFYLDETDRRIFKTLKEYPKIKNSPTALAKLYSYRSNVVNNLTRSLSMLGLDRVPTPAKSLEELFAEETPEPEPEEISARKRR